MDKFFNTAGLCFPEMHYMIDPLTRLKDIEKLIRRKAYFTIHAPRQTGKTTYLHALTKKLNAGTQYIALVVSFEEAGYGGISVKDANEALIDCIYQVSIEQLPAQHRPGNPTEKDHRNLKNYLKNWARNQSKPIVLFIDEIDALRDDTLISILRQLRDGFQSRPESFPSSIGLVGVHDIRRYFNVITKSLTLNNFSKEEVEELLVQHTQAAGQIFGREVKEEIFRLSNGQPWLVNALANEVVSEVLGNDYLKVIAPEIVTKAKQQLIRRRPSHLDNLKGKLGEERVRRIVHSVGSEGNLFYDVSGDDIIYSKELGIIGNTSPLKFANPIYEEIIKMHTEVPVQESIS